MSNKKAIAKGLTKISLSLLLITFLGIFIYQFTLPVAADTTVIWTDKSDYSPEETVLISGSGFNPFSTVNIQVTRPDGVDVCPSEWRCGELPITDENGSFFNYQYILDGIEGTYIVDANDGNNSAQTSFTDTRTTVSATLNGGSSVTVLPGASITAAVTGTLTSGDDWHSTGWRISTTTGSYYNCADTTDYSSGTHTVTFTITAPTNPGVYNVYFRISGSNSNCNNEPGSVLTMTGAVTVVQCTSASDCPNKPHTNKACISNTCQYSCTAGYAACDGSMTDSDGCEVNIMDGDTNNCGSCGHHCTCGQTCVSGVCTSPSVCGNGVLESGEECEKVGGNWPACCDSSTCQFKSSSTVCRSSAGVCDPAETCTGSSADCPADSKSTSVCRPSVGDCDVAESCDGVNNDCPTDNFVTAGTECRASAGICDVAEQCTGSSANCPLDSFLPDTTVCRAQDGPCDLEEKCTGTGVACPGDAVQPNGYVCAVETGQCDADDTCDGITKDCNENYALQGTSCDDGLFCNVNEVCDGSGNCGGGTARDCNDGIECTYDFCNEDQNKCENLEAPGSSSTVSGAFMAYRTIDIGLDLDESGSSINPTNIRNSNYAFTGEKIIYYVLVRDVKGKANINLVKWVKNTEQSDEMGPCTEIPITLTYSNGKFDGEFSVFNGKNIKLSEATNLNYDCQTDKMYKCVLTVESQWDGISSIFVEGYNVLGLLGSTLPEAWNFNPPLSISLTTSDGQPLSFGAIQKDQSVPGVTEPNCVMGITEDESSRNCNNYNPTSTGEKLCDISFSNNKLIFKNTGIVDLWPYIAATDFTDSTNMAECPFSNSLSANQFEYRAIQGSWDSGWRVMPEYSPDLGCSGITLNGQCRGGCRITEGCPINILSPNHAIEVSLKIVWPTPCIGTFDTGSIYAIFKAV
jgi:hypothetical protein